jgi:hypothetical protein
VTLFDVYECAISPVVLEKKINEAERRLGELDSVLVSEETYLDQRTVGKLGFGIVQSGRVVLKP